MAITATDIVFRLSTTAGAAGDSTASTPAASLGKYVSTTAWTTGTNSLFDNISGDENAASTPDYRCVFVLNNHATLTLQNAVVYVSAETAGGASVAIALDSIAASAKGASPAQAATIANEITPPSGVGTYGTPTTKAAGATNHTIGNLAPGQVKGIWIRRTPANSAALDADGFTLSVAGDTAA